MLATLLPIDGVDTKHIPVRRSLRVLKPSKRRQQIEEEIKEEEL